MKNSFYFPSVDERTTVHGIEWVPEGEPRAILQLVHGMTEYIDRYDEFASFMQANGFYVIGHDHVGHGESTVTPDDRGFFREKNGNKVLLEDMETIRLKASEKYPDIPYFILGHSMGSFLVRQFIAIHGDKLAGAVIMGTGNQPPAVLKFGMGLCTAIAKIKGPRYRSRLVVGMTSKSNNKRIDPVRTRADWLSNNEPNIDAYLASPYCTFIFTVSAYRDMFYSISECQSKKTIDRIPKKLPLLVTSGAEDPIGGYGKTSEQAYKGYVDANIKDVTFKLYEGDRHEILNELDRETVYQDLLKWFEDRM